MLAYSSSNTSMSVTASSRSCTGMASGRLGQHAPVPRKTFVTAYLRHHPPALPLQTPQGAGTDNDPRSAEDTPHTPLLIYLVSAPPQVTLASSSLSTNHCAPVAPPRGGWAGGGGGLLPPAPRPPYTFFARVCGAPPPFRHTRATP